MTSSEPCRVPVATVVARLRERPWDVQAALDGRVLTLEILLTDDPPTGYSIVCSPDGHISVFTPGRDLPWGYTPQIRLRGPAEQVLRVALGETNTFTAVFEDLMELLVPTATLTPHYPRLMRLVREELWALLDADGAGD